MLGPKMLWYEHNTCALLGEQGHSNEASARSSFGSQPEQGHSNEASARSSFGSQPDTPPASWASAADTSPSSSASIDEKREFAASETGRLRDGEDEFEFLCCSHEPCNKSLLDEACVLRRLGSCQHAAAWSYVPPKGFPWGDEDAMPEGRQKNMEANGSLALSGRSRSDLSVSITEPPLPWRRARVHSDGDCDKTSRPERRLSLALLPQLAKAGLSFHNAAWFLGPSPKNARKAKAASPSCPAIVLPLPSPCRLARGQKIPGLAWLCITTYVLVVVGILMRACLPPTAL